MAFFSPTGTQEHISPYVDFHSEGLLAALELTPEFP